MKTKNSFYILFVAFGCFLTSTLSGVFLWSHANYSFWVLSPAVLYIAASTTFVFLVLNHYPHIRALSKSLPVVSSIAILAIGGGGFLIAIFGRDFQFSSDEQFGLYTTTQVMIGIQVIVCALAIALLKRAGSVVDLITSTLAVVVASVFYLPNLSPMF